MLVVVRTRDATCGYTFHHNGKLAWTSGFCIVIKPKIEMSEETLDSFAVQMTMQLAPNHTNSESFNAEQLMEKEIANGNTEWIETGLKRTETILEFESEDVSEFKLESKFLIMSAAD